MIIVGLLLGLWLGAPVRLQPRENAATRRIAGLTPAAAAQPITMTRLRALLSYGKLRGQGIQLADIILIGSVLDIDTRK